MSTKVKNKIIKYFRDFVSSGKADLFLSYDMAFIFGKREGIYVWDIDGKKRLIDCHSNGGVFNLGHCNPKIIQVLKSALDEFDIGNHHLISEQRALLGQRLASLMPGDISRVVFGVGGGESIDLAIKLARAYTKRYKVISAIGGYHGHTGFALATGDEKYKAPFGPLSPGFSQVPFDDIDALDAAVDDKTSAVIFETIPATLGILVPKPDFFRQVRELCNKRGALLIIDEVQTGLGRTGKLWGIENFGIVPDIIVIGKGLSGGVYPITATCFRDEIEIVFKKDPFIHISTFGGAEIGCAVALEVLNISSDQKFLKHVNDMAEVFNKGLMQLKSKYTDIITSIRQLGLMMGIKMKNHMWGLLMTKACYDSGLLCIYANNDQSVLQVLPPLIIEQNEIKEVLRRLDEAFLRARSKTYQFDLVRRFIRERSKRSFEQIRLLLDI